LHANVALAKRKERKERKGKKKRNLALMFVKIWKPEHLSYHPILKQF
jgi:hypothetical protein